MGLRALFLLFALSLLLPDALSAHSAPSLSPTAPLRVEGRRLLDAADREFLLQGVAISGLEALSPDESRQRNVAALTTHTFRILRQRWNLNTLRLPVSPAVWRRDGSSYLAKVDTILQLANAEGLLVVLVATQDTLLPSADTADFWTAAAAHFKENGLLIFDLFAHPQSADRNWAIWRNGSAATVGMQQLVDRIRATGAKQLIAAPAFHDPLDFQGFTPEFHLADSGIIYEVHPFFDHALTEAARDANFGFLTAEFPLYAGEWGAPFHEDSAACRSIPQDLPTASDLVSQLLVYMFFKPLHWTASGFEPGQLIDGYDAYTPTTLNRQWTCGQTLDSQPGIGATLLLYLTGDQFGFGSIAADQMASAAGGPAGPVVPGQILVIYGQGIGPNTPAAGFFNDAGKLSASLAETEVRFDGIPAPIYAADYYQVKVQVPWELAGRETAKVRASLRGIPSNEITVQVTDAAPGLFNTTASLVEALAVNQDGTLNTPIQPAPAGSIVTFYATGVGPLSPQQETGKPAGLPFAQPILPVTLTVAGTPAEILFAAAAPGLVGVIQINARLPESLPTGTASVPLVLTAGARKAQTSVRLWVR